MRTGEVIELAKEKSVKSAKPAAKMSRPTPAIGWRIQQPEFDTRVERVRAELASRKLDALVLFHPIRMAYVSGFFHFSTERPMAIVVPASGGLGALIPQLEQEHIAKSPGVTSVKVYPEYPERRHQAPIAAPRATCSARWVSQRRGAGSATTATAISISTATTARRFSEVVADGVETVRARDIVDKLRAIKSQAELEFITESCVWGNLAHRLMQDKLALGRSEIDISMEASMEASKAMIAALGPTYQPLTAVWSTPAMVMFHAGANTALPHGLSNAVGLRRGDVLVTGATADVGGYNSELERTMIIGEPSAEFVKHFDNMMQLQQTAFDALRPGRTLAEAETDVSAAFKEMGLGALQRHHTGHGIGLEGHEAPFIDKGDPTVIAENMVLSVEPGLYVPGLAGFRHSDTVVIRADGCERLTYYPRDLDSMIVWL